MFGTQLTGASLSSIPSADGLAAASHFTVAEIDFRSDLRWVAFVTSHPEAAIYHHPAWLVALEQEYGKKVLGLACLDSFGKVHGVLPLMQTRGLPFNLGAQVVGRRLSSLPRTPVAGPLSLHDEATRMLLVYAVDQVREISGCQLQVKSMSPNLTDLQEGFAVAVWKEMYVLDLPEYSDDLRFGDRATRHRVKGAVNRALKLGVQVRKADTDKDLREWYSLYLETMRWHRSIPRPYRFFAALWNQLHPTGQMTLLLAEHHRDHHSTLLSGYMLLMCGQTVHCYLNGRRRDQLGFHPNDILQWHAIQDACRRGFRRYDFGEVEEGQAGLIAFKVKWGARPMRSYRYYYPAPRKLPTLDAPKSHLRQVAHEMWRRLPLKVTELVGDWIYAYL